MRRIVILLLLLFVAANIAAGLAYRSQLDEHVRQAKQAVARSPQARLQERRAELEQVRQAVENYRRRTGLDLGEAIQIFDSAAVGWDEITRGSSTESGGNARLDVLTVRGLAGSTDQLSRMDRQMARHCSPYRRTPTRDGKFILSCQARPR